MRHSKGYFIVVKTSKMKDGKLCITDELLDNKAWKNFRSACNRIRSIVKNKCVKHNYKIGYDRLVSERKKRMQSDIELMIYRGKYESVKRYSIRPMQIEI